MRAALLQKSLLLAWFFVSPSRAEAQDTTSLRIRVLDSASDTPLVGSRVVVRSATAGMPLAQAVTDSEGQVRIPRVQAGLIRVAVRRLGSIPVDTTVSTVSGVEMVLTVRLLSLSHRLAAVQVTAESQCPSGYGRLARAAPFASLLLSAVDSQLHEPSAAPGGWRVLESRRVVSESRVELEHSSIEWVAAEAPSLTGISRDTLEALGYSWRTDSDWHFALPHPSVFATQEFERLHCFALTPELADASREIRFVPSKQRVPNQLSGRLVFGGEPLSVQRLDLFFRGAPQSFGDSAARASITFTPTENARVQIDGWVVSAPTRDPQDEQRRSMGSGVRGTGKLTARVEHRIELRLDSTSEISQTSGETSRILRKVTRSQCGASSAVQCLQYAIALLHNASTASDQVGTLPAIGYLASVCGAGPLAVGQVEERLGDSLWIRRPPRGLPGTDARAYLSAFWEQSAAVPSKFRDEIATHVQLEACARLQLAIAGDPLLVTPDAPRDRLAEWTCAQGEAVICVQHALELLSHENVFPFTDSVRSAHVQSLLERGCFLRGAPACRLLAARDSTFDAESFVVSRLRGDGSTEEASRLLRSQAATHVESKSPTDTDATTALATEVRAQFAAWSKSEVEVAARPAGVLLTLHGSQPNRVSANLMSPSSEAIAHALGELVASRSNLSVLVVIHSDSAWLPWGSLPRQVRNRQLRVLNERRANAWNARLLNSGVERRRLRVQRAGDSEPLFSNLTRLGQQFNRRVEIALRLRQDGSSGVPQ